MSNRAFAPAGLGWPWPVLGTAWRRSLAVARRAGALIGEELARQAPRAFVWLVVAYAAGVVLFFTWRAEPHPLLGPSIAAIGLGGALLAGHRRNLRTIMIAVLAIGAGHTAADLRARVVATPVLTRTLPSLEIHGRVAEAEFRPTSHRIALEMLTVPGLPSEQTPVRVRLSIPVKNGLPKVGDHITVRAVLRPPMRPALPDGFEFGRFLYFDQIGATGYTFGAWTVEQAAPDSWIDATSARLESVRRYVATRVVEAVPNRGDATATAALIMGEQTAIPNDVQEDYRKSGLAHLLSISGVHMSLLAAAVFFVVRRGLALFPALALRVDGKKIAAWAGLFATTLYTLISGLSVPAERSFLMIGVVLLAILLDRTAISLRTIAWAALVLITIYPDSVIGASFEMSFMAVLALIALAEHYRLKAKWRGPDGELQIFRALGIIILGLAATDVAASGSTSLFAIYHFNRFPTYSMLSNFFAGPITGLWVMPWGLAAMLLMPFGLDHWPLYLMGQGVGLVNTIARVVGDLPGSQVHVQPMSPIALAVGVLGILVMCLWQSRWRIAGLVMFVAAVAQPWLATGPDVLMDENAKVLAISDAGGHLILQPGRGDNFLRDAWRERYGGSAQTWTERGNVDAGLRCDADGCILQRKGRRILIAFTAAALAEDCRAVDAAVSFVPGRAFCGHTPLADVFDVRRHGAVALRATGSGVTLRYAVDEKRDNRQWAPRPPVRTPRAPDPAEAPESEQPPNTYGEVPPDAPVP